MVEEKLLPLSETALGDDEIEINLDTGEVVEPESKTRRGFVYKILESAGHFLLEMSKSSGPVVATLDAALSNCRVRLNGYLTGAWASLIVLTVAGEVVVTGLGFFACAAVLLYVCAVNVSALNSVMDQLKMASVFKDRKGVPAEEKAGHERGQGQYL